MTPTRVTPENANPAGAVPLPARPRVVAAANENEVMLEQLEYLIEQRHDVICDCAACQRYLRARNVLMEFFADPPKPVLVKKSSASE